MARQADAIGDFETIGGYLSEMFHGFYCALALRNREWVDAYAQCLAAHVYMDGEAALDALEEDEEGRVETVLRAARFCARTGCFERGRALAREARGRMDASSVRAWVETALIEEEMLLVLGRSKEAAEILTDQAFWERVAMLEAGDDLLLRAWALNEQVRKSLGEETECGERAERARERWLAGQASPERAKLRVQRCTPLGDEDVGGAFRALKRRMALAETVGDVDAWMADALRRGALLVRQGWINQAEGMLEKIDRRAFEMADARYDPWERVLEARILWALGLDEEGDTAYREAVEVFADVFRETVFWPGRSGGNRGGDGV